MYVLYSSSFEEEVSRRLQSQGCCQDATSDVLRNAKTFNRLSTGLDVRRAPLRQGVCLIPARRQCHGRGGE